MCHEYPGRQSEIISSTVLLALISVANEIFVFVFVYVLFLAFILVYVDSC